MEHQTLGWLCDQSAGHHMTIIEGLQKWKSAGKIRASTNGTGLQSLRPAPTTSGVPKHKAKFWTVEPGHVPGTSTTPVLGSDMASVLEKSTNGLS